MALMPAFEVDHAEPGIATIWLAVYVPALSPSQKPGLMIRARHMYSLRGRHNLLHAKPSF
jgi:hypothetical protein